jgi:hypothetical protein
MESDIDISKLDANAANRLRALFEGCAAEARKGGAEAEETFLVGLAAMLQSYAAHRAAQDGEPMPEPIRLNGGGISTSDLNRDDCVKGARLLDLAGDRLHSEGYTPLATFMAQVGLNLAQIAQQKPSAENNSVVQ